MVEKGFLTAELERRLTKSVLSYWTLTNYRALRENRVAIQFPRTRKLVCRQIDVKPHRVHTVHTVFTIARRWTNVSGYLPYYLIRFLLGKTEFSA